MWDEAGPMFLVPLIGLEGVSHDLHCAQQGPLGPVYELERDREGRHGRIMRHNLNLVNTPAHLEEVIDRFVYKCNVAVL